MNENEQSYLKKSGSKIKDINEDVISIKWRSVLE